MEDAQKKTFGYELILDLSDCDLETISSKERLKKYAKELCKVIDMKPYKEPILAYFGENKPHTKGYSLVQLIETSSIVGHFSELWKTAYINIFSCKTFDPEVAKKFTKEFFSAKRIKNRFIIR